MQMNTQENTLVIRSPRPEEAKTLAELHLATWEETYADVFTPEAWGPEARRQRLEQWNAICTAPRETDCIRVAERDGALVGFAGAGASDDPTVERQLFFLYLRASEHGSGLGQRLLDTVADDRSIGLWVLDSNERALRFYRRNGFTLDQARRPSDYAPGHDQLRLVRPAPRGREETE